MCKTDMILYFLPECIGLGYMRISTEHDEKKVFTIWSFFIISCNCKHGSFHFKKVDIFTLLDIFLMIRP